MKLLDPTIWSGKIYVSGWVDAPATQDVVEPATGAVLGTIGLADVATAERAAQLASDAQGEWAATAPSERAAVLRRAGALFEEHAAEIQHWIIRESGSIGDKAALETARAAADCYEASALPTHPQGSILPSNDDHWSLARRRPVGVVTVIAPYNFPLILSIRSVAPALALGNAVLLKPDPRTAVCGGVALMRAFEEAGLPKGVLQLLPGGVDVGEAIIAAPSVRAVSFTGSTAAGRRVGALASQNLKRVHLELGGKNSLIVLPGADLAKAASAGAFGAWLHQGQICMATGRHVVHESIRDEYVAALAEKAEHLPIGDPASGQVALGPMIDARQRDHVHELVTASIADGARLAAGGSYDELFYKPTVLDKVSVTMRAWNEEIFGPVAPVVGFDSIEEAIAIARNGDYGLSLGILGDVGQAMRIADAVPSGLVHINEQTVADEANIPFGGVGASGNGSRFGGAEANIEAFTDVQWVTLRPEIAPYPF
jgi:benzaldehyde dehydrogenase (NAD)